MKRRTRDLVVAIAAIAVIGTIAVADIILPDREISYSERRKLAKRPELSVEKVFVEPGASSFMDAYETYAADQFPMREWFRSLHAAASRYLLGKQEVDGLYAADDSIAKLEYELHEESICWSMDRMNEIVDNFVDGGKVYLSIIPDKGYYLAADANMPQLDYDEFYDTFQKGVACDRFIDLREQLSKDNYYHTDSHWRQESLPEIAAYLLEQMGMSVEFDLHREQFSDCFAGVYAGQYALPVKKDSLYYLTGDSIDELVVTCYDSGKAERMEVYDFKKAKEMDPYELFLSGSRALVTIENPKARSNRELVLFRDSFSSSLAPLLAAGYQKITLVDIRYISPSIVGNFVDFQDADVLFLYSVQLLNNSVGQFIK